MACSLNALLVIKPATRQPVGTLDHCAGARTQMRIFVIALRVSCTQQQRERCGQQRARILKCGRRSPQAVGKGRQACIGRWQGIPAGIRSDSAQNARAVPKGQQPVDELRTGAVTEDEIATLLIMQCRLDRTEGSIDLRIRHLQRAAPPALGGGACIRATFADYTEGIGVAAGIVLARKLGNQRQHLIALCHRRRIVQIVRGVATGAMHHKPDAPRAFVKTAGAKYMNDERLTLQAPDLQTTDAGGRQHIAGLRRIDENGFAGYRRVGNRACPISATCGRVPRKIACLISCGTSSWPCFRCCFCSCLRYGLRA